MPAASSPATLVALAQGLQLTQAERDAPNLLRYVFLQPRATQLPGPQG